MALTPRQQVEKVLRGGLVSRVPFTMYETKIPRSTGGRELRNRGLCLVKRDVPVYTTHMPNVLITQHTYWEGNRQMVRTEYETPKGTLSTLHEFAGFTTWYLEKMFKTPDDYAAILFLIQDEVYKPNYEAFIKAQKQFGDDIVFRTRIDERGSGPQPVVIGLEPLQTFIVGNIMDMQTFAFEWMDRRDELLKIYDVVVENRRQVYPIVAQSPALFANYGGNVVPEVIGLETFEKYYVPHYNEASEVMHKHGKLIGCHFDANCKLLADAIAGTDLDYIEAFTPAPDTDMTLAEARAVWHDKVLWLNFPSSIHLRSYAEVEQTAFDLLEELPSMEGVLMGITEDMPPDCWQDSCRAIMDGLDRHAQTYPERYQT